MNFWGYKYARNLKQIYSGRFHLLILLFPIVVSLWLYKIKSHNTSDEPIKANIIHTHYDADKPLTDEAKINTLLHDIKSDSSDITILPELFMGQGIWFSTFKTSNESKEILNLKNKTEN